MRSWLPFPVAVLALTAWSAARIDVVRTTAPAPEELPAIEAVVEVAEPEDDGIRLTEYSLRIAAAGRRLVEERPPRRFRDDCSGFVSAVMTRAGVPMDGRVATIWASAERNGAIHHDPIPHIGDLVFFDNTHDRNHNGEWDDARTHIAVVVDVAPDGTILMAHNGSSRRLIHMNLLEPHVHETDDGQPRNSWLRRHGYGDDIPLYLTGQLWAGFATVKDPTAWRDAAE